MSGSYEKYQNKLKSNPFGVFGGSPKERVYIPQFDMPFKKISDSKPLIDLIRAKVNKTPLKLPQLPSKNPEEGDEKRSTNYIDSRKSTYSKLQ